MPITTRATTAQHGGVNTVGSIRSAKSKDARDLYTMLNATAAENHIIERYRTIGINAQPRWCRAKEAAGSNDAHQAPDLSAVRQVTDSDWRCLKNATHCHSTTLITVHQSYQMTPSTQQITLNCAAVCASASCQTRQAIRKAGRISIANFP